MSTQGETVRSLRFAGYLAILFGFAGTVSGLAGAGTFLPYEHASTFAPQYAVALSAIASVGAVASGFGIVAGWSVLRARAWAWNAAVVAAVGSVACVAAMTVIWPASWGFLLFVGFAYAIEVTLLVVGRWSTRSPHAAVARAA